MTAKNKLLYLIYSIEYSIKKSWWVGIFVLKWVNNFENEYNRIRYELNQWYEYVQKINLIIDKINA